MVSKDLSRLFHFHKVGKREEITIDGYNQNHYYANKTKGAITSHDNQVNSSFSNSWSLRYLNRNTLMSRVVRKPAFCICENKDADQLRGNREADQRLYFRYTDSTISLLPIYEISSLYPSCAVVQPGLCGVWSETPKTGFLRTRLI